MPGAFSRSFYSLQQTAAAVEDGKTFGGQGFDKISVHVEGIVTDDIVQIEASNDDALAFVQIGSDITADGVYDVEVGAKYYRAVVSDDSGGGTIDAVFLGT
jgi:hypothetical protein